MRKRFARLGVMLAVLVPAVGVFNAAPASAHGTCTALASKPTVQPGQYVVGSGSWACLDGNGNLVKHDTAKWDLKLQRRAITGGTWGNPPTGAYLVHGICTNCGTGGSTIIGQIANCNGYEYRTRIIVTLSGHSKFSDNSPAASC